MFLLFWNFSNSSLLSLNPIISLYVILDHFTSIYEPYSIFYGIVLRCHEILYFNFLFCIFQKEIRFFILPHLITLLMKYVMCTYLESFLYMMLLIFKLLFSFEFKYDPQRIQNECFLLLEYLFLHHRGIFRSY